MDATSIGKEFWDKGYLIFKNVFAADEISKYRHEVEKCVGDDKSFVISFGQGLVTRGDLLSHPSFESLIYDERILTIARQILGPKVVYFGGSSFHYGTLRRGWHRDSRLGHDLTKKYPLITFGVYLQDHIRSSGSLSVKAGSHQKSYSRWQIGEILPIGAGDLVVWNFRLFHSANSLRLRFAPNLKVPPRIEARLPAWMVRRPQAERIALFAAYGAPGRDLDEHMTFFENEIGELPYFEKTAFLPESRQRAESRGLEVVCRVPRRQSR